MEGDIRVGLRENSSEIAWWESLSDKEKDDILTEEENINNKKE